MQIHLSNKYVSRQQKKPWDNWSGHCGNFSQTCAHTKTLDSEDPEVAVNTRRQDDAVYTSPVLDP